MINFLKRLFGIDTNEYEFNPDEKHIIDMLNYHYRVNGIYNDMIIIDLDVEECDIHKGQIIKVINKLYEVSNIDYNPNDISFKYKIIAIEN
jgi:hypothetical protein